MELKLYLEILRCHLHLLKVQKGIGKLKSNYEIQAEINIEKHPEWTYEMRQIVLYNAAYKTALLNLKLNKQNNEPLIYLPKRYVI